MSGAWAFLSRTQGRHRLTWVDWITYIYLGFGFLLIFLPVCWLVLNSFKTQAQLEKQDLSLLPSEYTQVARATVYGPEGRSIVIIDGLPAWVLEWRGMTDQERATHDVAALLSQYDGDDYYALRSALGQVAIEARALIAERGLPDWMVRFPTMTGAARAALDVEGALAQLDPEEVRLMSEFLGLEPYQPNKLVAQILVIAPHPDTGETTRFAVPRWDPSKERLPARLADNSAAGVIQIATADAQVERAIRPAWSNFFEPLQGQTSMVNVNFARCFTNSFLATILATIITLIINSMAAFALSKYQFRGQAFFFLFILATLMVPATITLVGVFKAIHATGLSGSIWGVIIPGAATPAGVFLLRQYMLTIPDELLEAARMDAASEWKIYWRIMLPLALPAVAALGILSIVWRWNDLILPMVAIATTKDAYTIQLCLLEFRGEHLSREHFRLAMTVVSLIPTTLVFVFLQKYITTGIANTGLK
ncbi:Ribose ABC transport system, permease protein RbsC [Candidatus Rhodobacter oscarellae]|uniref:Ribose ABC transport system, permease protein RbsC n=1 Tax=Candidatus Rhodobacter oscarellae TaxID=1675527 RepID=A0A0J9E3D6_9RHOB|nr:carbohydrate ABC transporter permease [Candidatus Rhodobacter lobularis]KMW57331.1 Ribose ABC transport system, permease protein RbsC [Candidatus Rhodobacter lobularis]